MAVKILEATASRIEDIYRFTRERWSEEQAVDYVNGMFEALDGVERESAIHRVIPPEFEVDGYFFRYRRHYVYWRKLGNGDIGIVTVLHERMHQLSRFREDREP